MELDNYKEESLLLKIKRSFPAFNEEEMLEFTKSIVPNIHYFLSSGEVNKLKKYCDNEIITKILENKDTYRITKNIDNVRVGFAKLRDCVSKNDKTYIKVYISVFFYDDADNNENIFDRYDKYWNDIWIVTYEGNTDNDILNKCPNCGALMDYNEMKHMFTCNYCRNSLYYSKIDWKIVDIDVNNINYM